MKIICFDLFNIKSKLVWALRFQTFEFSASFNLRFKWCWPTSWRSFLWELKERFTSRYHPANPLITLAWTPNTFLCGYLTSVWRFPVSQNVLWKRSFFCQRRKFIQWIRRSVWWISPLPWQKSGAFEPSFLEKFSEEEREIIHESKRSILGRISIYFKNTEDERNIRLYGLRFGYVTQEVNLFWVLKHWWFFNCVSGEKQLHYFP